MSHLAEDRLLAAGKNVVTRCTHAEELPNVVGRAAFKMRVEPQRGVWPHKQPRAHNGVGDAHIDEGFQVGERMIEVIGPIESAASRAQALLAVAHGGESG